MSHRRDEGQALVESVLAILLIGAVVIVVGLSVVAANRSISSARKHSYATALLARYASVAQGVDCAEGNPPAVCDPPSGWDPPTPLPLGREVAGETTERGTVYAIEWSDSYEAPHGRTGNVRSRREISVTWQGFGGELTRSVEALGPPPDDPDSVAWLAWPGGAPPGTYCQIPSGGSVYTEIAGPQPRGPSGEWLVALPALITFSDNPGGGCSGPLGLAELLPGGNCEDNPDPRWTVPICPT